jgi:phosphatidate cytidylyltransferase
MPASENFKRVVVAVIAIPVILAATYLGDFYFFIFVAVVGLVSFYEFSVLVKNKGANANLIWGLLVIFFLSLNQYLNLIELTTFILLTSLSLLIMELFRNKGSAILNLGVTFLGIFYVGMFLTSLIGLREYYPETNEYQRGAFLLFSIFASIWIGDSAAYYGGTALGKHKLFPRVSPKKSWEGAIFGFIFSIGAMVLAKFIMLDFLSLFNSVVIGVIIGTFGQIGDLVESLLKRDSAIKDSSSLIPGHGGFLDRFDSLIFSAPVIWLYLKYFA